MGQIYTYLLDILYTLPYFNFRQEYIRYFSLYFRPFQKVTSVWRICSFRWPKFTYIDHPLSALKLWKQRKGIHFNILSSKGKILSSSCQDEFWKVERRRDVSLLMNDAQVIVTRVRRRKWSSKIQCISDTNIPLINIFCLSALLKSQFFVCIDFNIRVGYNNGIQRHVWI